MNLHQRIIGICWVLSGALILSLLAVNLDAAGTRASVVGVLLGLTFTAAGFALLANLPRSEYVCLPAAALSLLSFPVGTPIGVYYLWYRFIRQRSGSNRG